MAVDGNNASDFDTLHRRPLSFLEGLGPAFELAGDPVAWARPRFTNGRGFTQEKQRYAKEVLQMELAAWWRKKPVPAPSPLAVRIIFRFRAKRKADQGSFKGTRSDLDNLTKLLLDAANGIVWEDDAQVAHLTAMKVFSEEAGTFMTVETL